MLNLTSNSTLDTSEFSQDFQTPILPTNSKYTGAVQFDWNRRWLRGEEYAYMLKNIDAYCNTFKLAKLPARSHPTSIYREPQDGMVYFVEGTSVGSDFGFPRVETKKRYRWKKMNFTTDLPKRRPCVTYIVASAVKCGKFFPNSREEGPSYRMHAVILNKDGKHTQRYKNKDNIHPANCIDEPHSSLSTTCSSIADNAELEKNDFHSEDSQDKTSLNGQSKSYVLCHIRKIDQNYKTSRDPYPKTDFVEEEEEQYEEEDEELELLKAQLPTKKLFSEQNSIDQPKQQFSKEKFSNTKTPKFILPRPSTAQKVVSFNDPIETFKASPIHEYSPMTVPCFSVKQSPAREFKESVSKNSETSKISCQKSDGFGSMKGSMSKEPSVGKPSTSNNIDLLKQVNQNELQNVDYIKMFASLVHNKNC